MKHDERFTKAFAAYLAGNRGPEGQPAEYGVSVEGDTSNGVIELALVFKRGVRYCCAEWGCHLGLPRPGGWDKLRRVLLESGIELVSKIELRLRVIVEQGALLVWHESLNAPLESSAYEYQEILREGEEKGYRVADPPPNYTGTWTRYGPDGRKLDEKDYVNGRLQGRVTLYGGKEQKCREFYVIDGQRHGTMTQWNHKGEIIDVSEWVAGTGTYRIYYSSGQLSSEQQMRRGELHGVARYWNGKGELTCTEYYEDGELIRLEGKPRPGHHRAFQSAPKCGKKAGP